MPPFRRTTVMTKLGGELLHISSRIDHSTPKCSCARQPPLTTFPLSSVPRTVSPLRPSPPPFMGVSAPFRRQPWLTMTWWSAYRQGRTDEQGKRGQSTADKWGGGRRGRAGEATTACHHHHHHHEQKEANQQKIKEHLQNSTRDNTAGKGNKAKRNKKNTPGVKRPQTLHKA